MDFNTWKGINDVFVKNYNWSIDKQLEETWNKAQNEIRNEIIEKVKETKDINLERAIITFLYKEEEPANNYSLF